MLTEELLRSLRLLNVAHFDGSRPRKEEEEETEWCEGGETNGARFESFVGHLSDPESSYPRPRPIRLHVRRSHGV